MLLSPFDPDTIYFGAQSLFRSHNRGDTWERLTGDASYNDKTRLGDIPHQLVITISESPKKKGVIYAGTDDGRLYVSQDDGKTWAELTANLPKKEWIAKVLASQFDEATVYVAQQGRYDEDFAVRLYKSTDYGKTFKSIAGNLHRAPARPHARDRNARPRRVGDRRESDSGSITVSLADSGSRLR